MNFAAVTVVHSGYGRYLSRWVCNLPRDVTPIVVIGQGLRTDIVSKDVQAELRWREGFWCADYTTTNLGELRNLGCEVATTRFPDIDWLTILDVDDMLTRQARDIVKSSSLDVVLWSWLDVHQTETHIQHPLSPRQMAELRKGRGWFNNSSPFRASVWKTGPFPEHDYPGAPFILSALQRGHSVDVDYRVGMLHIRRKDSFSARTLHDEARKAEAYRIRTVVAAGLRNHYGI